MQGHPAHEQRGEEQRAGREAHRRAWVCAGLPEDRVNFVLGAEAQEGDQEKAPELDLSERIETRQHEAHDEPESDGAEGALLHAVGLAWSCSGVWP